MNPSIINEDSKNAMPINILLVEDNEDDIEITQVAFEEAKIKNRLNIVRNGLEALDYLYGKEKFQDRGKYPMPKLMLVDINMPKMSGLELLERLKRDDKFKLIPVVILTSSKNEEDVVKSYGNGASAYLPKPVSHEAFVETINNFNIFWHLVELPNVEQD